MKLEKLIKSDSWVACVVGSIKYEGRAIGKLSKGTYVVLRKPDGSVSVQARDLNQPRNYIRAKEIILEKSLLICINKKEKIIIDIRNIQWFQNMPLWSGAKVKLYKTEAQLVDKLIRNIKKYLPDLPEIIPQREFAVPGGKVDVAVMGKNKLFLFEVKRRKCTLRDIRQVLQYDDHIDMECILHLVAPDISENALKYATINKIKFIELTWDEEDL